MSRLYVRVFTGFFTHRKTARLRAKIGDDALWLLPRLWAYCAENQPDGDLSGYQADELAVLVGYSKDASSMLQALQECGWVDSDGRVHDWEDHNGYHETYAKRAKIAAEARWSKKSPPSPPSEKQEKESGNRKVETSIATSMLVASTPSRRFVKPSLDELRLFFSKAGCPETEAEKFTDFYDSKGWLVGKTPMKSWQGAAGGWASRWKESARIVSGKHQHQEPDYSKGWVMPK